MFCNICVDRDLFVADVNTILENPLLWRPLPAFLLSFKTNCDFLNTGEGRAGLILLCNTG